jgi:hypothetical protein
MPARNAALCIVCVGNPGSPSFVRMGRNSLAGGHLVQVKPSDGDHSKPLKLCQAKGASWRPRARSDITESRILCMEDKQGPNVLLCIPNRTKCILLVSVMLKQSPETHAIAFTPKIP